jgi:hypothetical protein
MAPPAKLIVSEVFFVQEAGSVATVALVVKQCWECAVVFALPITQRQYVCPNGHKREEGPRYDDFIVIPS